jgi:hypothetical protein
MYRHLGRVLAVYRGQVRRMLAEVRCMRNVQLPLVVQVGHWMLPSMIAAPWRCIGGRFANNIGGLTRFDAPQVD